MDLVGLVLIAVWVMLPAYLPNNVAVIAGGGRPIDRGLEWRGHRLLGDGKTWRGTIAGVFAGVFVALLLNGVNPAARDLVGIDLPLFSLGIIAAFPTGAMLGDIAASFLKRRTGRARGNAFPVVDQLDFVVMALLVAVAIDPHWMRDVFTLSLLVVVLVVTPILHVGTNVIGYHFGLKREPW